MSSNVYSGLKEKGEYRATSPRVVLDSIEIEMETHKDATGKTAMDSGVKKEQMI